MATKKETVKKETVKKTTKPKAKTTVKKVAPKVEVKKPVVFDDDDLVTVFNYFNGTLNLRSKDPTEYDEYVFEGFMDEQDVRYGFLRSLVRTKSKALTIPRIYIGDEDVIKSLKLDRVYKNLFNPKDLDELFKKPVEDLTNIIDKADRNMKSVLRDIALAKIQNKQLNNYSAIKILSEKLNFHLQDEF